MPASSALTRRRLLPAIGFIAVLVALSGCGTLSRTLRGASVSSPTLAVTSPAELTQSPSAVAEPEDRSRPGEAQDAAVDERAGLETVLPGSQCALTDGEVSSGDDRDATSLVEAGFAGAEPIPPGEEVAAAPADAGAAPALRQKTGAERDEYDVQEHDPWEGFNEKTFEFNRKLDRYVLKPAAKVYDKVTPDEIQRMVANAFDNLGSFKRLFNSALQGKWKGAGREVGRFLINSTVGIAGFWDIARQEFGIAKSNEDFGQTLGVYGSGPGPYLVLPFLEPMTVRDGIGRLVDSLLDPLGYFFPMSIVERVSVKATEIINDRSLNLELFQGFEETVIDMYSAVRHAYLERRRNLVKE